MALRYHYYFRQSCTMSTQIGIVEERASCSFKQFVKDPSVDFENVYPAFTDYKVVFGISKDVQPQTLHSGPSIHSTFSLLSQKDAAGANVLFKNWYLLRLLCTFRSIIFFNF